jgi:CheY-like chemotaxis protein
MKIVAATAYAFNEKIQECFAAGMDNYLAKPVDVDKLEEILKLYNIIE